MPNKPEEGCERELDYGRNGTIKTTLHNSVTLIANDPRLWGVIGYNVFFGQDHGAALDPPEAQHSAARDGAK